jgi:hypothetical protein
MSYVDDTPNAFAETGGYGGMPQDAYLRKIEQTNYYEDPEQLESFFRSTLVDLKPDKPWLASDEARSPEDRGSGNQSTSRLDLRHSGARSSEDPYLPDGTFLDWEFTQRDPRGIAIGPNMREGVKQQYARADLIKFYDDSDYSVPSEGVNPEQMRDNIKKLHYQFKDRYQNFEESFDAWHNGGTNNGQKHGHGSSVAKYTHDGTIMDLTEAEQGNRTDAVARLSADPKVAYRHSTPDHRFKIAKYGAIRVNQFLKENDWSNNRMSTFQDHNNLVEINGTMVNRGLANLIIDLEGLRETKQEVAKGAEYGDSYNTQVRSAKLSPSDVYKIMMIDMSSPDNANTQYFDGQMIHRNPGVLNHDHRNLMEHAEFNHEIAGIMLQATRKQRVLSEDDVHTSREQIEQSAKDHGLYNTQKNNGGVRVVNSSLARESYDTRHIEESKQTMNYAGIKPNKNNRVMDKLDGEAYGKHSLGTHQRKGNREGASANKTYNNEYDQDQGRLDFGTYDRADRADPNAHVGRDYGQMDIGDGEYGTTVAETDIERYLR